MDAVDAHLISAQKDNQSLIKEMESIFETIKRCAENGEYQLKIEEITWHAQKILVAKGYIVDDSLWHSGYMIHWDNFCLDNVVNKIEKFCDALNNMGRL